MPPPARHRNLDFEALKPDTFVCIGAFDGIHLGHQALLRQAMQKASHCAVATFLHHPATVLAPQKAPKRLQNREQREAICGDLGVDHLEYWPFDQEIAKLSPEEFVRLFLLEGLQPAGVVVGDDFRFGARRAGDVHALRDLVEAHGISLTVIPEQSLSSVPNPFLGDSQPERSNSPNLRISSSQIRRSLAAGDLHLAARCLGRYFSLRSTIEPGQQRGAPLGFPTANLHLQPELQIPPWGVYAGWVSWPQDRQALPRPAVANLGQNPTFDDARHPRLEVHVLDLPSHAKMDYQDELEFHFVQRLRGQQKFEGIEELRSAIAQDIQRARARLTDQGPAGVGVRPLRDLDPESH